jgi:hypothetical protein
MEKVQEALDFVSSVSFVKDLSLHSWKLIFVAWALVISK